jgi:hypothetical protein
MMPYQMLTQPLTPNLFRHISILRKNFQDLVGEGMIMLNSSHNFIHMVARSQKMITRIAIRYWPKKRVNVLL